MPKINYQLAETQRKFGEFYQKNLHNIYTNLEPKRHEYLHKLYITVVICAAIVGFTVFSCARGYIGPQTYESEGFLKLALLALLVMGYLIYAPFSEYRTTTKSRVMNKILSFWGDFRYFHEHDIIGRETIKEAELFTYFNQHEVDDAFRGSYNKSTIYVSEHKLQIHGRKGDTNVFKGVFILLDFNKKFKGQTVVLNRWRISNMLFINPLLVISLIIPMIAAAWMCCFMFSRGELGIGLLFSVMPPLIAGVIIYLAVRHFHKYKATQKVELEEIPFARRWKVLTSDQVEARYILTPILMEKIAQIKKLFKGRSVDFSFFDNKLLIAVHTRKNLFETTSLLIPALSYHKIREVISQLHSIFSVIDLLELNRK